MIENYLIYFKNNYICENKLSFHKWEYYNSEQPFYFTGQTNIVKILNNRYCKKCYKNQTSIPKISKWYDSILSDQQIKREIKLNKLLK